MKEKIYSMREVVLDSKEFKKELVEYETDCSEWRDHVIEEAVWDMEIENAENKLRINILRKILRQRERNGGW